MQEEQGNETLLFATCSQARRLLNLGDHLDAIGAL